ARRLTGGLRWLTMAATIFLACGVFTLIRTGGFTSDFKNDFAWRWSKSAEERLLAQDVEEPAPPPPAPSPTASPVAEVAPGAGQPVVAPAGRPASPPSVAPPARAAVAEPEAVWPGFR